MKYLKDEIQKIFISSLVTAVVTAILGIFLLVKADFVLTTLSTIIGIIILIPAVISLIDYFKTKYMANLIIGVTAGVMGIVFIVNPKLISSILPFVLGIYFIIDGFSRLQYAMEMKKNNVPECTASFVSSILILVLGVLMIVNPFKGAMAITQVIGIFLLVHSALDLYNAISAKGNVDKFLKEITKK